MSDLMLHRGSQLVDKMALDLIPLPQESDSYKPVSHYQLVNTLSTIGQDILKAEIIKEQYAVSREGKQFFGVLSFGGGATEEALSIGIRNSYDRSMSVGFCTGLKIFICDNLAFSGSVTVLKKHTPKVWEAIENLAISTLYKSQKVCNKLLTDLEAMRRVELDDNEAYRTFGLLYGHNVLSPRQLTVAVDQWKSKPVQEFAPRNGYSLYNACTEALKSSPPLSVMENHIRLHKTLEGVWQ